MPAAVIMRSTEPCNSSLVESRDSVLGTRVVAFRAFLPGLVVEAQLPSYSSSVSSAQGVSPATTHGLHKRGRVLLTTRGVSGQEGVAGAAAAGVVGGAAVWQISSCVGSVSGVGRVAASSSAACTPDSSSTEGLLSLGTLSLSWRL